jgi:hypothetical protein
MNFTQAERLPGAATRVRVVGEAEDIAQSAQVRRGKGSQLAILTAFWAYVALSNVLYARSMSATLDPTGAEHFFAPWTARVLQHVFLYPVFIACIRGSLCVGWRSLPRSLPIQLLLAVLFAALAAPLLAVSEILIGDTDPMDHQAMSWPMHWQNFNPKMSLWIASATGFLLTYGFGLALISGFSLYQRFRDSELRRAALERAWSGARLAALRMQLSPHTLFNLLHTIRGQISWDPAAAQSMIVQLGDLLRRLLDAGQREFSPLRDELEFARLYLELQQRRFADRLTIVLADSAQLPPVWVPSLILQPLIENAVVHGLARHDGPVAIRLEVQASADRLVLRVINSSAPGRIEAAGGIGLPNVRERLSVHFGGQASLTAGSVTPAQWIAELDMPLLRKGPDAQSAAAASAPRGD